MEFSRQEYRSMLPFPSPEDLPDPGIKPRSPALWGDSLFSGSPGEHNARGITLNGLNCPTDERSGRLYQSCFKAAAWIHSTWLKATSRLIPVMRSRCWQKWFPTTVTAGRAAASSWNASSCWRWHSKNPCRRERGVDGVAGLVLGVAGDFTLSNPFQLFQFRDPAAAAKSLQSCPTLCDPIDSSPPGSAVPGILQAKTLEWVAIASSNAWKWKVKVKSLSRVRLLATPWTTAYQAPPSMGFSRQEYWSGVPLPSPSETLGSIYFALQLQLEEKEAIPLSTGKVEIVFHFLIT